MELEGKRVTQSGLSCTGQNVPASVCTLGWPETCCENHAGLTLSPHLLGLEGHSHTPGEA